MTVALALVAAALGRGARSAPAPDSAPAAPAASRPVKAPPGARVIAEGWFPPAPARKPPPKLPKEITRAYVIPIRDVIDDTMYESVRRKVLRCRGKGAEIVVFDLNTPGGSSRAMEQIVRLIVDDLGDIYTVAYVNPTAYSAGAIISLACDEIVFTPTGVFGAAMPIMIIGGRIMPIPEKERGKFESASRAEIRMLAKRNGHNALLCEAMVTITMEIWLIRKPNGELRIVDAAQWRGKVGGAPATTQPYRVVGRAKPTEWEYVLTIDGPKELVTPDAEEAVKWGFTRHVLASMDALREHYHITSEPTVLADSWSETLVGILTSAPLVGFLIFLAILCGYIEMHTPGFGVAGSIAIACFAILVGSRFLVGLANWWEIALFIVGLILLAVEIFITPGFGVLGTAGIFCCIVGLLAMIIPNPPTEWPLPVTRLDWSVFRTGLLALGLGFLAAVVGAIVLARILPEVPVANRLVLSPKRAPGGPPSESAPILSIQPGQTGVVASICRPVGQVRFGEQLVDAIADGEFLPAGAKVKVLKNEGNRVVVTPVEA